MKIDLSKMNETPQYLHQMPDYEANMGEAIAFSNNAVKLNFLTRFFKKSIMGIRIKELSLKRYIILLENENSYLLGDTSLSACIKYLYELRGYKYFNNSLIIRSMREYLLLFRCWRYISKKYGKGVDFEKKIIDNIIEYSEITDNETPGQYEIMDPKKKGEEASQYYWVQSILSLMAMEYGWTEEYMLEMPYQVFFGYYHLVIRSKNPDYKKPTKADIVWHHYVAIHERLKNGSKN